MRGNFDSTETTINPNIRLWAGLSIRLKEDNDANPCIFSTGATIG
jgi:hypothetical protein